MGPASSDKTKSRGAPVVHVSTAVTEQSSGGGRRLRLLLIYAVQVSKFRYSNDKRLTMKFSHSTWGPSPGVAEVIVWSEVSAERNVGAPVPQYKVSSIHTITVDCRQ
jgi:hypothetical protein